MRESRFLISPLILLIFVESTEIPNYPDEAAVLSELDALNKVVRLDIEEVAKELKTPKSANVILLGMAAPFLDILSADELRSAIGRVFASKGEAIVEANYKAFDAGLAQAQK